MARTRSFRGLGDRVRLGAALCAIGRGGSRFVGAVGLSALVLLGSSCTLLIDSDRQQCSTDLECQKGDPATAGSVCVESVCQPNPTWACLGGDRTWPTLPTKPARITFQLQDLVTETPAVGVTARVCRKLDFDCNQPLAAGLVSDASGTLAVDVEVGFDGYVELTGRERLPGVYFFYPPVTDDRVIGNVPMIRPAELFQFASLAGRPLIQGRGHVMLGAYDCVGRPAEGVSLSSDDADSLTSAFYLVRKVPSLTALGTDSSGRGGLINLRAGSIGVKGANVEGLPIATVGMFVRPGAITYTTLLPVPR